MLFGFESQGKIVNGQSGFSLVELLVVVAILGITAALVVPVISTSEDRKLDLAAEEIAQAIRFARSESLRTNEAHGVNINQTTQRVVVYKANLATTPVSIGTILYHPVSKQLFDYDVDTAPMTNDVYISNTLDPFLYGTTRRQLLLFSDSGTPIWIDNTTGTTDLLDDGTIQLSYRGSNRFVEVAPITGRVSVY